VGARGGRDGWRVEERAAVERGGEGVAANPRALGSGSGRRASRCAAQRRAETHEARSPVDRTRLECRKKCVAGFHGNSLIACVRGCWRRRNYKKYILDRHSSRSNVNV
jgi:hypothetical protein